MSADREKVLIRRLLALRDDYPCDQVHYGVFRLLIEELESLGYERLASAYINAGIEPGPEVPDDAGEYVFKPTTRRLLRYIWRDYE